MLDAARVAPEPFRARVRPGYVEWWLRTFPTPLLRVDGGYARCVTDGRA